MEKTHNLFRKFLPIILSVTGVGLFFGLLTLLFYYDNTTVSVDFKNVIPVLTTILLFAAVGVSIYFTIQTKKLHILKIKKDSGFSKFATLLAAVLSATLFFFDFFRFVLEPTTFSIIKIVRLFAFVPFIAYFIINIIPKKVKRNKVNIPNWLKPACSIGSLIWCMLSLISIYFYTNDSMTTTNLFRILHIVYYVLAILFFLFEVKFELFGTSHRGYMITSLLLFIFTAIASGSVIICKFLGRLSNVTISEFEIILAVAIGVYALSRMFAIQSTLKHVISRSGDSTYLHGENKGQHGHHSHHRHHSSHSSSSKDSSSK